MSTYDEILAALDGVRPALCQPGILRAHRACCPCHEHPYHSDRAVLSLAENTEGTVLIHCFSEWCEVSSILDATGTGLGVQDLFVKNTNTEKKWATYPGAFIQHWASAAAAADSFSDGVDRVIKAGTSSVRLTCSHDDFKQMVDVYIDRAVRKNLHHIADLWADAYSAAVRVAVVGDDVACLKDSSEIDLLVALERFKQLTRSAMRAEHQAQKTLRRV